MKYFKNSHLNEFSLDNFISGTSNTMAIASGTKWCLDPKGILIITAPCGCGKTHLAGGIGNKILEIEPNRKIGVFTSISEQSWPTELDLNLAVVEDVGPLVGGKELLRRTRLEGFLKFLKICAKLNIPVILTIDESSIEFLNKLELESYMDFIEMATIDKPDRNILENFVNSFVGVNFSEIELGKLSQAESVRVVEIEAMRRKFLQNPI